MRIAIAIISVLGVLLLGLGWWINLRGGSADESAGAAVPCLLGIALLVIAGVLALGWVIF